MNLVIIESPNKTKKIAALLGDRSEVLATQGHFRDLPEKERGVDLWTPTKNILAGTRLLAILLRHYQGDLISALVAYNARAAAALHADSAQWGNAPVPAPRSCFLRRLSEREWNTVNSRDLSDARGCQ